MPHLHEVVAAAAVVDGARYQFLTGPALATNQNGRAAAPAFSTSVYTTNIGPDDPAIPPRDRT